MLFLSDEDVAEALSFETAIAVVEDAFLQLSQGTANVPLRTHIDVPEANGVSLFMPARLAKTGGLGIKLVSVRPKNAEKEIDTVPATIILLDDESGLPLAIMEASHLTIIRTAAGSAVATRHLALENASKLVVYGAGNQAAAHIEAIQCVRKLTEVSIVNRTQDKAVQLQRDLERKPSLEGIKWNIITPGSPEEASVLSNADIIVTATNSPIPLFDGRHLKKGVHINCIGSYRPNTREVDSDTVVRAKFVADSTKQVLKEAGEIAIPLQEGVINENHIVADIGQVIAGLKVRTSPTDITLFKSVGNAVQDVSVAQAVYNHASKSGQGILVEKKATQHNKKALL